MSGAFSKTNVVTTLLPGSMDHCAFEQAARMVVADFEALRLRLRQTPAGITQYVVEDDILSVPVMDFASEPDPELAARNWLAERGRHASGLFDCRMFDWVLLRVSTESLWWGQIYHPAMLDHISHEWVVHRLSQVCDGLSGVQPIVNAPSGATFAQLVAAERQYLGTDQAAADRVWWDRQVSDLPEPYGQGSAVSGELPFPISVTRPIPDASAMQWRMLARRLHATSEELVCAAFIGVLAKLTYQKELLVGVAVPGRSQATTNVVARLAHLMPLRVIAEPARPFTDLVMQAGQIARESLEHERMAFGTTNSTALATAHAGSTFAASFTFLAKRSAVLLNGYPVVSRTLQHSTEVITGAALVVDEDNDGALMLHFDTSSAKFKVQDAERLLEQVELLLNELLALGDGASGVALCDLTAMVPHEYRAVTDGFASGAPEPPRHSLLSLLHEPMTRRPRDYAIVAVSAETTIRRTYGDVENMTNRLARHLLASGVRVGDTAAVLLPRGDDLVAALLACIKAGIAYCPLDPLQPPGRLAQMTSASQAKVLITNEDLRHLFVTDIPVISAARDALAAATGWLPTAPLTDEERGGTVDESTIAYVIFTSGSTGVPKGVAVSHGAIAQQAQAAAIDFKLEHGNSVLSVTSIAFDPATLDIFLAMSVGATLVMLDDTLRRDAEGILAAALEYKARLMLTTPSMLRVLQLERLPADLAVVCGGEPFPTELLPRMSHLANIFNAYGPTEAAVATTLHRPCLGEGSGKATIIGRPMAGYRVWIVDRALRPVPIGSLGELCIGGGALASGYVGEAEQTEAAFPTGSCYGGRIYRTGDLARWRPDGVIEMLGRIDKQIKIRGYRIEPAEVEYALRSLPWVADAAVLALGEPERKKLTAYVVLAAGHVMPPLPGVHSQLSNRLPAWMLPAACLVVPALPQTATGKVDRMALQALPAAVPCEPLPVARPPGSKDEKLLCRLFERVIGRTSIDANTDFFFAGGDSLAAMILVTHLRQLGRELSLSTLFAKRTPAGIANHWGPALPDTTVPNNPTLIVIPGAGGTNPGLAGLCADLSGSLNVILLDYPDWGLLSEAGARIENVAAHFAQRITASVAAGPVFIAGYSLGGIVGRLVAEQLAGTPITVRALLLMDADATDPGELERSKREDARLMSMIMRAARLIRGPDRRGDGSKMLGEMIAHRLVARPTLLRLANRLRFLRLPSGFRYWLRFLVASELQIGMVERWQRSVTPAKHGLTGCKVIAFKATERATDERSSVIWSQGWAASEVYTVHGDHFSVLNSRANGSLHRRVLETIRGLAEADAGVSADITEGEQAHRASPKVLLGLAV